MATKYELTSDHFHDCHTLSTHTSITAALKAYQAYAKRHAEECECAGPRLLEWSETVDGEPLDIDSRGNYQLAATRKQDGAFLGSI